MENIAQSLTCNAINKFKNEATSCDNVTIYIEKKYLAGALILNSINFLNSKKKNLIRNKDAPTLTMKMI